MALQGEHDNDGVDEAQQRDGPKVGHEALLEALLAESGQEGVAGDDAGNERHAQEQEHALCNLPEADVDAPCCAGTPRHHLTIDRGSAHCAVVNVETEAVDSQEDANKEVLEKCYLGADMGL